MGGSTPLPGNSISFSFRLSAGDVGCKMGHTAQGLKRRGRCPRPCNIESARRVWQTNTLVTRTGRCEHITPVLRELHWLPVRHRVEFKIATLVFKALNNLAPPYLVDDCNLVSDDTRRLRSAASVTCTVPRTRARLGDRSFAVAGPLVWNSLPAALRAVEDYKQFKAQLKTHLFDWLKLRRLVTFAFKRRV